MKSKEEILATFTNERYMTISILSYWSFDELEDLRKRYIGYPNAIFISEYVKNRIDLLEEAIIVKKGNEEQAWDYLS